MVLKIVKTVWPVMLTNVAIGAPLSMFPPLLRVLSAHRSLFACSFRSGCRRRCGGNQDKVDVVVLRLGYRVLYRFEPRIGVGCVYRPGPMLMYGKVSQENYVELTAASAMPNKEIKSPQILRC